MAREPRGAVEYSRTVQAYGPEDSPVGLRYTIRHFAIKSKELLEQRLIFTVFRLPFNVWRYTKTVLSILVRLVAFGGV